MTASPYITPGEDPEMEQASVNARRTFKYFWREMSWESRRIVPGLEMAAVKAAFSDPPEVASDDPDALEVEHMWLVDVHFDGQQISGTLINNPMSLKSYSEGDNVKLRGKQISDWMYVIDGEVYGGFTIDLMRTRMDKGERKQHDQAWGLNFGEAGIVNLVPPEYIGEPPAKKGLLGRLMGAQPKPQDHAAVAAAEHPMSVNMRESLDQAITEDPAMLEEVDDHGMSLLHQLALAGSLDGVDVCLRHGADPNKPAANGMTPAALARSLGWKRVVARVEKATEP